MMVGWSLLSQLDLTRLCKNNQSYQKGKYLLFLKGKNMCSNVGKKYITMDTVLFFLHDSLLLGLLPLEISVFLLPCLSGG